jgi:recombination protein RecR
MDASSNPAPVTPAKPRSPRPGGPVGASAAYPESVTRLIEELSRLPGIGRRSAERLTFHILKAPEPEAMGLSRAIADVKQRVSHCRVCYNLMDAPPTVPTASDPASAGAGLCAICAASNRDRASIMVVEQPKDLIALEQTSTFKGLYHVLMGRISPLEGVSAGDLTIADLLARIDDPAARNLGTQVGEVVLALNPTLEGDGTALYLAQELERRRVRVTRLARGLPTGSQLEFASKAVLADAIQGRRRVE